MKTKKKLKGHLNSLLKVIVISLTLLISPHFSIAQPQTTVHVFEDWAVTSGTQNFFYKNVSKTDGLGNIYLAGATLNSSGNYDILLRKYNSSGTTLWTSQYAGAAGLDDIAADIYIDNSGNVFVTGAAAQNAGDSQDLILIKYNSSGIQQWISFYNNPSGSPVKYDGGTSIDVDGSGNIYVGGGSVGNGTGSDYITLKFNSSGVQQSVERYDYNGNHDIVTKIQYNASNLDIVVSGASQRSGTQWDFATVSYHMLFTPTVVRSSGTTDGIDEVSDMQIDASGNIYITGTSKNTGAEYDFKTVKLNSSMVEQWFAIYDGDAHLDDRSNALRVDASGNVYVTGYTTHATQGRNFATIKYNSSGTQQWIQYHNGLDNGNDESNALAIDNAGNVYVTGQSSINGNLDYYTIKYNSGGTKLWERDYNGIGNGNDKASGISLDGSGGIIVSGQTQITSDAYSYTTVRYIESLLYEIPDPYDEPIPNSFECVENRGQLIHTDNSTASEGKYYTKSTSPSLYFQAKKVSMVWARCDSSSTDTLHTDTLHRIDMVLGKGKGNNGFALNPYKSYHNYYFSHSPDGIERINSYNTIVYPDIYSNIDAYYTANNSGIRTQFVIKPGGSASSISIDFEGASSMNVDGNGDLVITSSIGSIKFKKARVFQIDSLGNGDTLTWQPSYNISDSTLTFSGIGAYNSALPLVLEMFEKKAIDAGSDNLTWSTLYGNSLADAGAVIKTDAEDNIFVYGGTMDFGFPNAVSQVLNSNAYKYAFLIKFRPDGEREWTTIFGSSHMATNPSTVGVTENIKDMAIGSDGYIYFCGTLAYDLDFTEKALVGSTVAYTSSGVSLANDRASYVGRANIFDGELGWAQLFVGTQRKLLFNENNELYMIGEGGDNNTNTGLPLTNPGGGAYYDEAGYGTITKFNTDLSVAYCTRFASETGSSLTAISQGPNNSMYIAGYSQDSNFPESATGNQYTQSYTTSPEGSPEGIVFQLSETNEILWSTYIGGNHQEIFNDATFLSTPDSRLCLVGWTNSTNFPTQQGAATAYQASNLNADTSKKEAIILLFDDENALIYSSYYGSQYDESLNAVTVTPDGRFFMGGFTNNSNISTIPYGIYYDQPYNNRTDALVLGMDNSGNLFWSTCLGGVGPDQIHGICTIGNERLFATGQTSARNNPSGDPFPTIDNGTGYFDGSPGANSTNFNFPDVFITEFSALPTLSLHEHQNNTSSLLVYPNPTESMLNIMFYSTSSGARTIKIIDLAGKVIQMHSHSGNKGSTNVSMDVSFLPQGIYFLHVIDGNELKTVKFIRL